MKRMTHLKALGMAALPALFIAGCSSLSSEDRAMLEDIQATAMEAKEEASMAADDAAAAREAAESAESSANQAQQAAEDAAMQANQAEENADMAQQKASRMFQKSMEK